MDDYKIAKVLYKIAVKAEARVLSEFAKEIKLERPYYAAPTAA
jgi:hypothetical protein